jgi:hypothetical protein
MPKDVVQQRLLQQKNLCISVKISLVSSYLFMDYINDCECLSNYYTANGRTSFWCKISSF